MSTVERPQIDFGTMEKEIRRKLQNNNDAKIIIQGTNSQTGIGKTTFALQLCRDIDLTDEGWSAKEKAFVDVSEYIEAHQTKPKQSCLMLDEIEAGADSRRAMSHENVQLSQAWATMRAQNIATVATLPSVSMLDNRMLEMADYWVLVRERGLAQPYRVEVNDFNGKVRRQEIRNGEHVQFQDLPNDDIDKQYLDDIKDSLVMDLTYNSERIEASDHERKVEQAREEERREMRNEAICEVYHNTDLSTKDMSEFDWVDVNQSMVSKILNRATPAN